MKTDFQILLFLLVLALPNCIGMQVATFHPDGSPRLVAQVDAIMAEGEASAREITMPNGVAFRSVQQRYDATRVPGQVADALTVIGVARALQPAAVKGTKDPNIIPKDPNVIPVDPNVIPVDPNVIPLDPN